MKKEILGIDLGSGSTRIYSYTQNRVIFDEPTCLALDSEHNEVKAIGYLAQKIQGKAPHNCKVVFPVQNGLVSDINLCSHFLQAALYDKGYNGKAKCAVIFSSPCTSSKVNMSALARIGQSLQADEVYIESSAKLAAIGSGEKAFSPHATLVADIGAGQTDIGLISMGDIVSRASLHISGRDFNDAIRRYLLTNHHFRIGESTAEYIKLRIGSVTESENRLVEVRGRDTITSLPSSLVISSGEIRNLFKPLADIIAMKITDVISEVSPELSADLVKSGLILTGGSSQLYGLKDYLQSSLSIPVSVAKHPTYAVINGIAAYCPVIETRRDERRKKK